MTRAFLVSLILGSGKTTVSVTTGHTSYWPLYLSIGNILNNVHCTHQNGVVLLGFLAILKCKWYISLTVCTYSWKLHSHESLDDFNYWRYCHQLLPTSHQKILEPVRPYMTALKVVHCLDGHYHWAIFLLGPYIADHPEQCLLAFIVQGWCPWYVYIYFSILILILLVLVAMLHEMILILDDLLDLYSGPAMIWKL